MRYNARQPEIVLEAAQLQLKHGVTTVRDSYGVLSRSSRCATRITRGEAIGRADPRRRQHRGLGRSLLGVVQPHPRSRTHAVPGADERQITQDAGEDARRHDAGRAARGHQRVSRQGARLRQVRRHRPTSRAVVHRLLARGTARDGGRSAQARDAGGDPLDDARRAAAVGGAGIDGIQHPEASGRGSCRTHSSARSWSTTIVCSMLVNTITGDAWEKHLKDRPRSSQKQIEDDAAKATATGMRGRRRPPTSARRPTTSASTWSCGASTRRRSSPPARS